MNNKINNSNSRELFRFARIKQPRILDIEARLQRIPAGKTLLKKEGKERLSECEKYARSSKYIDSLDTLSQQYFCGLAIDSLPQKYLPNRDSIKSNQDYQAALRENSSILESDQKNSLFSLYSAIVLQNNDQVDVLTRLVQFLEIWPNLETIVDARPYAPLVLKRYNAPLQRSEPDEPEPLIRDSSTESGTPDSIKILDLWNAANQFREMRIGEIEKQQAIISKSRRMPMSQKGPGFSRKASTKQMDKIPAKTKSTASQRQQRLAEIRQELLQLRQFEGMQLAHSMLNDQNYMESLGEHGAQLRNAVKKIAAVKSPVKGVQFCDLYKATKSKEECTTPSRNDCDIVLNDPCLEKLAQDIRRISGSDSINPLGEAELIVVEERWSKYTVGEISNIETVLKNEKRAKSVDVEKIFEQTTESFKEEITQDESESQATTANDLKSEIQNELNSSFNSSINASASGSGGGSIGVVDFSGEGTVGSNVSFGIDTSMSSSETSNFSSEIVKRALEKTKKTTSERRISRTYDRYASNYSYEVDNTGDNSNHINGAYVFLDKHICITEKQYGLRQFLIADLMHPGSSLLKHELKKQLVNLSETGLAPSFDILPQDITTQNYLTYSGQYKASNLETPPPLIKMVSSVYKTDTSNESKDQGESKFRKVVEVLVPFFGQYKRFLIQDTLEIPAGYRAQEVRVTVTHGSNGMSIPAHLPFTLGGAVIYAMPKLMVSAIPTYSLFYLPIALYEIMHLASPVMHYNADSSNVSISIGHTTKESPYFFFQPEDLIMRISNILAEFPDLSNDVMSQVQTLVDSFLTSFSGNISTMFDDGLIGPFNNLKDNLSELVDVVKIISKPIYGAVPTPGDIIKVQDFFGSALQGFLNALKSANLDFTTLFEPLGELVSSITEIIGQDMLDAFRDELNNLMTLTENSETLHFPDCQSFTGSLPVSFNCIALKPGLTINLTACLIRIEDQALDAWRLQTHERLYASYRQLAAEYETQLLMKTTQQSRKKAPAKLRATEHQVIKDRVLRVLKTLSGSSEHQLNLNELKLFEHAIDWDNLSYRLYNYTATGIELVHEKIGLYQSADARRKHFLNATWSQVLIPLKEDEQLESMMMAYMQSGEVTTLDELIDTSALPDGEADEIAAIYQDVILRRKQIKEDPPERHREEIVPTDLVVIFEGNDLIKLPRNADALADLDGS